VKRLNLQKPSENKVIGWYESSLDGFRDKNWLGRPEASIELHLLSGTKPVDAKSFERIEPLLDNLRLIGCVKDISVGDALDLDHDEKYLKRLEQIDRSYARENNWEMLSYLENIYQAVPNQDISLEFFSSEVDVENLDYNVAVLEDIEEVMKEDKDFSITGIELNARSEANYPEDAYTMLENSTFFDLFFLYGGDENLTEEYNQFTDEWGDQNHYSGVPGVVQVGRGRPTAYFFDSQELSADGSEIDSWLYDNLSPNIGAKSEVRKKNLE